MRRLLLTCCICLFLAGCTGTPEGIRPVGNFELERYLGRWYEIARLDHSFERGLSHVTAEYSMRQDGGVRVLNKGYDTEQQQWQSAEGRAYFVDSPDTGHLRVSFFGPFYGAYVIFKLDQDNYQYSYISGYNRDYLWLLARTPTVSDDVLQDFITTAQELGFATEALIFPNQALDDELDQH